VPHVVDPIRARALRVFFRIDTLLREAFLEDGVGKAQIRADAAVEGVVARGNVIVAPAELPGVCREDAGGEAGVVGPCQE